MVGHLKRTNRKREDMSMSLDESCAWTGNETKCCKRIFPSIDSWYLSLVLQSFPLKELLNFTCLSLCFHSLHLQFIMIRRFELPAAKIRHIHNPHH